MMRNKGISMSDYAIELRQLEKQFGDFRAVDTVNIAVPPGSFLALLGPSGCGKTTILRMLAGLEAPTGGEICFNGRSIASGERGVVVQPGQRDIGLVFQSYALWPHMTVRENVEWPLKVKKWPVSERKARVTEVLQMLDIARLAERYPGAISGGQQQRVAIARTIAPRPKILLFDEPLSNLDAKLRAEMRTELLRVHRLTGATSVYVTHDQVEAMTMASHVAVMRSGKVEQFGSPHELLEVPATRFVATFIGTPPANVLLAEIKQAQFHYKNLQLGSALDTLGERAWLMYRAEELRLHTEPGPNRLFVEFAEATPMAGRALVTVWDDGQRLSVVTDRLPQARLGDHLYLEFPHQPTIIYPEHELHEAQSTKELVT
jgi:iron(III) transport system ATP-binding protein